MTGSLEPIVEARAVEKFYPQPDGHRIQVLAPIDLAIAPDGIVAILGPSGSGKSTLLRILAGLTPPSAGTVLWQGMPLATQVPSVAVVFQSFALFPWLTVLENVEAPLVALGLPTLERHKRALRLLDTVGLDGFEGAYPKELSGGMKQRVGFARALVVQPEVLFMDEAFSALDVLTAEQLRDELVELWVGKKMPTRAIFMVTHSIEEAVLLADRVLVFGHNPGRIRADLAVDLPRPRDRKSARFLELVDHAYQLLTQPEHPSAGDVAITPEGRVFAEADKDARKQLFREAALERAPLLRKVERALRTKADRALPEEFFLDVLDEHFTDEESRRQLDTLIHWGRYAGILDYDADRGRVFLTEA